MCFDQSIVLALLAVRYMCQRSQMSSGPMDLFFHVATHFFEGDLQKSEENQVILEEGESIIRGTCHNAAPEIPLLNWEQYYM